MKKLIFIGIYILFINCSPLKNDYDALNSLLVNEKYIFKSYDIVKQSYNSKYCLPFLEEYLKIVKKEKNNYEYYFDYGYDSTFTENDIVFMKSSIIKNINWNKSRIKGNNFNIVKNSIFLSEEDENKDFEHRILEKKILYNITRPVFNLNKDKAIIVVFVKCKTGCFPHAYFLLKENKNWKVIGRYESHIM